MIVLVSDLDGPPLHDGEEVKGGLDEHGPSLQITLHEVHKGLLHHPTGLIAEGNSSGLEQCNGKATSSQRKPVAAGTHQAWVFYSCSIVIALT